MADTTELARLVVSLEARLDKYNKQMAKLAGDTDKTLGRVEGRFKEAEARIGKFSDSFKSFGAGLLASFSAGAIVNFARNAIKSLADIGDAAKRAGVGVEDLQAAMLAARTEGASGEAIVAAFGKLNKTLGEAAQRGNDLGKILGPKLTAALQGDPVRALKTIADLIKNAATAQDRGVIAAAAFGKGYQEILPFLIQGSAEIQKGMDAARETGAVIDKELIATAKEFDDAWVIAWASFEAEGKKRVLTTVREVQKIIDIAKAANVWLQGGQFRLPWSGPAGPGAGLSAGQFPKLTDLSGLGKPDDTTKKTSQTVTDAQRQADAIASVIKNLHFESEQLTRTGRERAIYNELAKAGVTLDTAAGKNIADLTGKFYDQEQALKRVADGLDFARDATKGFLGDLISGLREGKKLTDILGDAFSHLADKLIDRSLDQLIELLLGKSGSAQGGLFGQLLGIAGPSAIPGAAPSFTGNAMGSAGMFGQLFGRVSSLPAIPVDPVTGRPLGKIASGFGMGSAGMFGDQSGFGSGVTPGMHLGIAGSLAEMFQNAGIRRNNPGNLEFGSIAQQFGGIRGAGGRFAQFPDLMSGFAAQRALLESYGRHGINTVGGILNKYAPPSDQLPGAFNNYKGYVSNALGVGSNTPLNLQDPATMMKLQESMTRFEQGLPAGLNKITDTVQSQGASFAPALTSGLQSILSAVTPAASGLLSFLGGANVSGGLFGGGRADGGPVNPGMAYTVGERGAEMFMPRVPGVIVPNGGGAGGKFMLEITEHPMFAARVRQMVNAGNRATLEVAKRHAPYHMARFQSLGTT